MTTNTKSIDKKVAELRAQLEEAESEKQAAEKAERERIERAKKHAADSHVRAVLGLYDLLGIEPEHPHSRTVKGKVHEVTTDKTEQLRTERLVTLVEKLANEVKPEMLQRLQREDEKGRQQRRPSPKHEAGSGITASSEQTEAPQTA